MLATNRPPAIEIPKFPLIAQVTGGLSGYWPIAGGTGVGKTTWARHLAYSVVGPALRVAYLDLEGHFLDARANTGILACFDPKVHDLANRYMDVFQDSEEFRQHVESLPPGQRALIVIDHIQIDADMQWKNLDALKGIANVTALGVEWANRGHAVLALSQVPRAEYGRPPRLQSFKGSSAIEAAAHIAGALWRPEKGNDNLIRFEVMKPRFIPKPEHAVDLLRDGWSLREIGLTSLHGGARATTPRMSLTPVQKAFAGRETARTADILSALRMLRPSQRRKGERWIARAVANGEIRQAERGVYVLGSSDKPSDTVSEQHVGMSEAANVA